MNQELNDAVRFDCATVRKQIALILSAWGMPDDQVVVTADIMTESDTYGIDSHGISMLMFYEKLVTSGALNLKAQPQVIKSSAVTALIDGDAGLGHPVSTMAMNLAVAKCHQEGIGVVSVFNSHHFGAAGYYAKMAADTGAIGMVTSSARGVFVTPTFAKEAALGTNPIAFAAPSRTGRPFLLDMSTSTVASNKIKVYDLYQRDLPSGWVIDSSGRFVTDSAEARSLLLGNKKQAGITPLGGSRDLGSHKGYGLAMMVQILSSTLSGAGFSPWQDRSIDSGQPDNIGHFFLAIDPSFFRIDGQFEVEMSELIDFMHSVTPVDASRPVLVAGDPEFDTYQQRKTEGIPLAKTLIDLISAITDRANVPFLLDR